MSLSVFIWFTCFRGTGETRGLHHLWCPAALYGGGLVVRQHGPTACGNSPVLSTSRISALFPSGTGAAPVPSRLSWLRTCKRCPGSKERGSRDVPYGAAGLETANLLHVQHWLRDQDCQNQALKVSVFVLYCEASFLRKSYLKNKHSFRVTLQNIY